MPKSVMIASGVRTAIGDFMGSLAGISPCSLAAEVIREAVVRAGLEGSDVEQTVLGNVIHTAPEDMYVSRVAAIRAGLPQDAPALTLNRLCGSGLQAVVNGVEQIILGHAGIVVAGGTESMSRAGHLLTEVRSGKKMGEVRAVDMMVGALTDPFGNGHMGMTAENLAVRNKVTREIQDRFAAESHRRAAQAISEGRFKEQILPLKVKKGRDEVVFDTDEHVRPHVTPADLAKLRPAFDKEGTVTAGNASGVNDGAAALVLVEESKVSQKGLNPLARIVSYGLGGVAPDVMGLGPIPAVKQALRRACLSIGDLKVVESNEAFAAQACAVSAELGFDPEITNPNGGAVALGHPIGASGAVILVKLIYELRRRGGGYGLATMCIGGGQGIAMIVEAA